jgi:uncharacterized protein YodC (DUF2158 family)
MEEVKLVVGDVVILKSGSPKMTVKEINDNVALCEWWDKPTLQFKSITYSVSMLQKLTL